MTNLITEINLMDIYSM